MSRTTRYVEFFDGTYMTDGHYSDVSGQVFSNEYGTSWTTSCFMVNENGNIDRCSSTQVITLITSSLMIGINVLLYLIRHSVKRHSMATLTFA